MRWTKNFGKYFEKKIDVNFFILLNINFGKKKLNNLTVKLTKCDYK